MIQEIAPKTFDPAFRRQKPEDRDFLLLYEYNKVMLKKEGDRLMIPTVGELLEEAPEIAAKAEYLFSIDDRAYFGMPDMAVPEFGGYVMEGMQIFRKFDPMYQGFAGITGGQIYRFRESRKFCGRCGQRMEYSQTERAMVCPGCKQTEYPKISPAVIVAITNGDKLLMSRYAHGTYRHFALIAGYVEVGETFEECVRREVMEEVGLKVKNIRYYKSQPWAFTDTEMIGFFAELDGDDAIRLQEDELSEAGWYRRDEIPEDVSSISVGSEMKMAFKHQRI